MTPKVKLKNTIIHYIDGASFFIGISLCSFSVIIPAYVKHYTNSPLMLALIPVIFDIGTSIPQLFNVYLDKKSSRKETKKNTIRDYFISAIINRISFWAIGFSILFFSQYPSVSLLSFYIFFIVFNLSLGVTQPNWINLISVTVPDEVRTRFTGNREFFARTVGIIASFSLPFILGMAEFPKNYAYLFIAAGFCLTIGIIPALFYEPITVIKKDNHNLCYASFSRFIKIGLNIIWINKKLLGLLMLFWSLSVSRISNAFYTPYIIDSIISKYPADQKNLLISILNIALLSFVALTMALVGKLIPKVGYKKFLAIGMSSLILANTIVVFFPFYWSAVLGQFFLALFVSSAYLVSINAIMDYTEPGLRSTIIALNSNINAVFIAIFSIAGSGIAKIFNFQTALLLAAFFSFIIMIIIVRSHIRPTLTRIVSLWNTPRD